MATYVDVLTAVRNLRDQGVDPAEAITQIRRSHIQAFQNYRGRNLICYYSGWSQGGDESDLYSISDDDMNSFMACLHGMDVTKGLDLILQTPGGDIAATQSIVTYLHKMFACDLEVFVPHLAMSCGTMIACASKVIHMCKHSSLGPIDVQYSGIPAQQIIAEFEQAQIDIDANEASRSYWEILLSKYPVAIYGRAKNETDWAASAVKDWLTKVMFKSDANPARLADAVVQHISSASVTKTHSKHIMSDEASAIGLRINSIEADQALQDLLLGVHYSYVVTFGNTSAIKIVENQFGFDRVILA